jgi:polyphosphate glucokinase
MTGSVRRKETQSSWLQFVPVTDTVSDAPHQHPFTIAIDVGGTGLKADVLDKDGVAVAGRVRVPTTYPMPPHELVSTLTKLVAKLPEGDRVSCGFPGMVRQGHVLSAPHFVLTKGPGTKTDPKLFAAWSDFNLAKALTKSIGKPCRVANDADVQGLAVVRGKGFEAVITLGTGFGTAFFMDGSLMPHIEFSHLEFRKGETFNEQLGEPARKKIGDERWNKRVRKAIDYLDALCFFDHLYIGGGNAGRVNRRDLGDVLERITVVDNRAGILGGIKLWGDQHVGVEGGPQ